MTKRNVKDLKVHPINLEIYGEPDLGLVKVFEQFGWDKDQPPIHVNESGEILSGARRWAAACDIGWDAIPAKTVSPEDVELHILLANQYRDGKSDWIKKLEADGYYVRWQNGDTSWEDSDKILLSDTPSDRAAKTAGFDSRFEHAFVNHLFDKAPRESKHHPEISTMELDIDHAASEEVISESQHSDLNTMLCEKRAAVKRNEIKGQAGDRAVKSTLQKAKREYGLTTEEKAQIAAVEDLLDVLRKGRGFVGVLHRISSSDSKKYLGLQAAMFVEAILFEARGTLENLARQHSRKLAEAPEQELRELQQKEIRDVRKMLLPD